MSVWVSPGPLPLNPGKLLLDNALGHFLFWKNRAYFGEVRTAPGKVLGHSRRSSGARSSYALFQRPLNRSNNYP